MCDDQKLLEPPPVPFTESVMFTSTFVTRLTNIGRSHEELSRVLAPLVRESRGPVKALNSNYAHACQPGYERYLKHPRPAPPAGALAAALAGRGRAANRGPVGRPGRGGKLAPITVRQRKPQGDGTSFNSAVELTIILDPAADDLPDTVREVYEKNRDKHYAVKSFPASGEIQVPGVIAPDLADGTYVADCCAAFLTGARIGVDPRAPIAVEPGSGHPIMANFKFQLVRADERIILDLDRLTDYFQEVKVSGEGTPYPIREIKPAQDGQNLSFKFLCPNAVGGVKTVRVNFFVRGKINILGSANLEAPKVIYDYLSRIFIARWHDFVSIQPLPDRVIALRRAAATGSPPRAAPPRPPSPDLTIPPGEVLPDDVIDDLLAGVDTAALAAVAGAAEKLAFDAEAIFALALTFGREFGLDDSAGDEMDSEDVE